MDEGEKAQAERDKLSEERRGAVADFFVKNEIRPLENNLKRLKGGATTSIFSSTPAFRAYVEENYDGKSFTSLSKNEKISALEDYIDTLKQTLTS